MGKRIKHRDSGDENRSGASACLYINRERYYFEMYGVGIVQAALRMSAAVSRVDICEGISLTARDVMYA